MKSKHDKHWRGVSARRLNFFSVMGRDRQTVCRWPLELFGQMRVESPIQVLGLPSLPLIEIKAAVRTLREQTSAEQPIWEHPNPFGVSALGSGFEDLCFSGPVFLHSELTDDELGLRCGVDLLAMKQCPVIRPERQGVQTG